MGVIRGDGGWGAGLFSGGVVRLSYAGAGPLHSLVLAGSSRLSVAGESRSAAFPPFVCMAVAGELEGGGIPSLFDFEAMSKNACTVSGFLSGLGSMPN
jgi:hypothetical protein